MKSLKILSVATLAVGTLLFTGPAKASPVSFTFTGTGANGSTASGEFTVDETALVPNYFAEGGIFPSLSVTISNIPGGGPNSVTFSLGDLLSTWFFVDSNGVAYIAPYGTYNFGAPGFDYYALGQPSQPFPGQSTYQTALTYDISSRDLITWSPAAQASSDVPEAGGTAVYLAMALVALGTGARRWLRLA
jgi:hypothetical protein